MTNNYLKTSRTLLHSVISIVLILTLFSSLIVVEAGVGNPVIRVRDLSTPLIKRGERGVLEMTVYESKGEDWAMNVTVTVIISKLTNSTFSESGENVAKKVVPRIDAFGSKKYFFVIEVPLKAPVGTYSVEVKVDYLDPGWNYDKNPKDYQAAPTVKSGTYFWSLNNPPISNFTYTPSNPTIKDTVQFTDASTDIDGVIRYWRWDFGDGTNSSKRNPTHKYQSKAKHAVNLTVTDNNGYKDTKSVAIDLRNLPPKVDFNFSPENPLRGDNVTFTDSSVDLDGWITSYSWDFGDGTASDEKTPIHKYEKAGIYVVKLTVEDEDGETNVASKSIEVGESNVDVLEPFRLILIVFSVLVALILATVLIVRVQTGRKKPLGSRKKRRRRELKTGFK